VKNPFFAAKIALLFCLAALGAPFAASAQTTVSSNSQALLAAAIQSTADGQRITLDFDGTIYLTNTLTISNNPWIEAESNRTVSISGSNLVGVFRVKSGASLTLVNLNVIEGKSANGAGIYSDGGAITAVACSFTGNTATNSRGTDGGAGIDTRVNGSAGTDGLSASGGAIYTKGVLEAFACIFSSNNACGGDGGNGGNGYSNTLTFGGDGGNAGNGAAASGGAIVLTSSASARIGWTLFSANSVVGGAGGTPGAAGPGGVAGTPGGGGYGGAAYGGAIYNGGGALILTNTLLIANSAFAGVTANAATNGSGGSRSGINGSVGAGGAIYNSGKLKLINCSAGWNLSQGGNGANILVSASVTAGNGGDALGGAIYSTGASSSAGMIFCTFNTNGVFAGTNGTSPATNSNGSVGKALGAAIYNNGPAFAITNSMFGSPAYGANLHGSISDGGYNISSDKTPAFTAATSSNSLDPMIESELTTNLATNSYDLFVAGTYVATFEIQLTNSVICPRPSSPAVERIPTNGYDGWTDERGVSRPQADKLDIGAVELLPANLAPEVVNYYVNGTNDTWSATRILKSGSNITVGVKAGGVGPLSYQWIVDSYTNTGQTNATIILTNVQPGDSGAYSVLVSNRFGSTVSSNLTVQILDPVAAGKIGVSTNLVLASFEQYLTTNYHYITNYIYTNAAGDPIQTNSSGAPPNPSGGTDLGSNYFTNVTSYPTYKTYTIRLTNGWSLPTNSLVMSNYTDLVPANPNYSKSNALVGWTASLFAPETGSDTKYYQWYFQTNFLTNQTLNTLTITNVQKTNAGTYTVTVSNAVSMATNKVGLLVNLPASILTNPPNGVALAGSNLTLSATVAGDAPVFSRWTLNGKSHILTNKSAFTFTNVPLGTNAYFLSVSNAYNDDWVSSSTNQIIGLSRLTISNQPAGASVLYGSNATLSVDVSGGSTPSYQWYLNNVAIKGATNSSLTATNAGRYTVKISDGLTSVVSSNITVTVGVPPTITRQPQSRLVSVGATNVTLSVSVKDTNGVSYQWLQDGEELDGETNSVYAISSIDDSGEGTGAYAVRVTGKGGTIQSSNAWVLFQVTNAQINGLASGTTSVTNNTADFLFFGTANGLPSRYQWYFKGAALAGQTNDYLILLTVSKANAGQYKFLAVNALSTNTATVTLAVYDPPVISSSLTNITNAAGSKVTIKAQVSGSSPLTYLWQLNGANLPSTSNTVVISKAALSNAGTYTLTVANPAAETSADIASLAVVPPAPVFTNATSKPLTNASLVIGGTVDPAAGVSQVILSGGGITTNIVGTNLSAWSAPRLLYYGTNTLTVFASNQYGLSATNTARFVVAISNLFTFKTNGNGTANPNLNGKKLLLGQSYTLVAAPGTNMILSNWTWYSTSFPTSNSTSPSLTFSMQPGTVVTANFMPDPYRQIKGAFSGLVVQTYSNEVGETVDILTNAAGALSLTLSEKGVFTGKTWWGTNVTALSGQFDSARNAFMTNSSWTISNLDWDLPDTNTLTGAITGPQAWTNAGAVWTNATFTVRRAVTRAATNPVVEAGQYTFIAPDAGSNNVQAVAAVSLGKTGAAVLNGYTADTSAFSASGTLATGDLWPMFAPMNSGLASISGWLAFARAGGANSLGGSLLWLKADGTASPLDIASSPYAAATNKAPLLSWSQGWAVFTPFGDAGSDASWSNNVVFTNNALSIATSTNSMTLRFNKTNGLVSGSFRDASNSNYVIAPFFGVILTNQNAFEGFFHEPGSNGLMRIESSED